MRVIRSIINFETGITGSLCWGLLCFFVGSVLSPECPPTLLLIFFKYIILFSFFIGSIHITLQKNAC